MRVIIVAIKDTVTGEIMTPFYVHNTEEAARVFKYNLVKNEMWSDNKDQFEMYTLGMLDTQTGNIISAAPEETGDVITIHPDILYKGIDILS